MSEIHEPSLNGTSAAFRKIDQLTCVADGIANEAELVLERAKLAPEMLAHHLPAVDLERITLFATWLERVGGEARAWCQELEAYGEVLCARVDLSPSQLADPILARLIIGARLRTAEMEAAGVPMAEPVDEEPPF